MNVLSLRRFPLFALLGLALAIFSSACEEEAAPPPPPEFKSNSTQIICEDDADGSSLFVGASTVLYGEKLSSVKVEMGGLGEVFELTGDLPLERETGEKFSPQTWHFEFDASRRVLCNESLVLTFTAFDEQGESTTISAKVP